MILSLIGPPCAGKGTQARMLVEVHRFTLIGAGDLLREKAKTDPECQELLNVGALVPVNYIWALMEEAMEKAMDTALKTGTQANILLDGYPRELEQAVLLDKYLTTKGAKIHIVNLHVESDLLIKRMLARLFCYNCGKTTTTPNSICCDTPMSKRPDDTIESFTHRLEIFHQNINIIKEFYKGKDTCDWHTIDAGKPLAEMNHDFMALLDKLSD